MWGHDSNHVRMLSHILSIFFLFWFFCRSAVPGVVWFPGWDSTKWGLESCGDIILWFVYCQEHYLAPRNPISWHSVLELCMYTFLMQASDAIFLRLGHVDQNSASRWTQSQAFRFPPRTCRTPLSFRLSRDFKPNRTIKRPLKKDCLVRKPGTRSLLLDDLVDSIVGSSRLWRVEEPINQVHI